MCRNTGVTFLLNWAALEFPRIVEGRWEDLSFPLLSSDETVLATLLHLPGHSSLLLRDSYSSALSSDSSYPCHFQPRNKTLTLCTPQVFTVYFHFSQLCPSLWIISSWGSTSMAPVWNNVSHGGLLHVSYKWFEGTRKVLKSVWQPSALRSNTST